MSRKPQKGYFVQGRFVAQGSELDIQFRAERKGTPDASRTDLKRASDALQTLGKNLLTLRADLLAALGLPDVLLNALAEVRRISDFEGRRRQMQYVGKLMRKLDPALVQAARQSLEEQHRGSASEKQRLHLAERWRERLLADDSALAPWMAEHPTSDAQQLRALIRQTRKDAAPPAAQGLAPRQGRAWRELFQFVRGHLDGAGLAEASDTGEDDDNG
ncbi:DUF615 domain-containing protein [Verminephrobacter aporrectodeae subsp. tuberculatae]|uniref:ribosome biogenesis factor YjgA n=1 Tax=Verminephrobacter aporrectodeae TaxID=1110389 RepID=UPI0022386358|nr:ribosome biogenesis factor YjgA [Verminephrobacter aporrectodeae]MCW5258175.1 DUF615 domain-containing protein [Verminephrobacter aporrectodeae subsp. tuberculatae]